MTQVDQEYELVRIFRTLSETARPQVLQFAKTLQAAESGTRSGPDDELGGKSLLGAFGKFGIGLTDEELAQARREMWANFPRDITDPSSP